MSWYHTAKVEQSFGDEEALRDMWNQLLSQEQSRVGVSFDLENNDHVGDVHTVNLDYKSKKDASFRVCARLWTAGGDWECPSGYFRCQFQDKHENGAHWSDCVKAIIIPVEGNPNLKVSDDGKRLVALHNQDEIRECGDLEDRKLWSKFKGLAEKRIATYYDEYRKDPDKSDQSFENTGCLRSLLDIWSLKEMDLPEH